MRSSCIACSVEVDAGSCAGPSTPPEFEDGSPQQLRHRDSERLRESLDHVQRRVLLLSLTPARRGHGLALVHRVLRSQAQYTSLSSPKRARNCLPTTRSTTSGLTCHFTSVVRSLVKLPRFRTWAVGASLGEDASHEVDALLLSDQSATSCAHRSLPRDGFASVLRL